MGKTSLAGTEAADAGSHTARAIIEGRAGATATELETQSSNKRGPL